MSNDTPDTDFAIGAFVWNEGAIKRILTILKDLKFYNFKGRIILGGPQVSYVKKQVEAFYPEVDLFIRGYAENPMLKLMQGNSEKIVEKGVHYKGDIDAGMSAIANLEDLPSPYLNGIIPPQRFIRWETQRGCKFRCKFCQHREPDKSLTDRRHLSEERINEEIK